MRAAVFLILTAMTLIPLGDSAGKVLSAHMGVSSYFVAGSRFAIGAIVAIVIFGTQGLRLLSNWRVWLRALPLVVGINAILIALSTAPFANVFAAFFIGPLLSYVFSAWLLREPVSRMQSLLIAAGFIGVLIVVRPGPDMNVGMGWAALAGISYGLYLTTARWLSTLAPARDLLTSQLVIGAMLTAPVAWLHLPAPELQIIPPILISALGSMTGNLLLLTAYSMAPATRLAPLIYFQLVSATVLGYAVFGDIPDGWSFAGLGLVLVAGLWSASLRNRRARD